jgi:hypothetical protein
MQKPGMSSGLFFPLSLKNLEGWFNHCALMRFCLIKENLRGLQKLKGYLVSLSIFKYNPSTRSLAQGVFLKKVRLDLIDGL